ncbi:MAG: macrolide ABC transporter ATP-binding protein, partial [Solimonas sp.]
GLLDALNEEGITIVLVTHDTDVASHARRRIVLRDGRVVEDVAQAQRGRVSAAPSVAWHVPP